MCNKQSTTFSFSLKNVNSIEFKDCLPNKLKDLGYQTYSIHGASGELYDRLSWYPKAGFKKSYFFNDLSNGGMCKSFSGRCDVKIIPKIKSILHEDHKSLVYWMTLNTHAPYDDKLFINGLNCRQLNLNENSESCKNLKLHYQFFSALSQLIDDPSMQGLEVYVAGDHSPPIFNMRENLFTFKGASVAWIHFKIK